MVGHLDCGMAGLRHQTFMEKVIEKGIKKEKIETISSAGIDLESWLTGFEKVEHSVEHTVHLIKKHPLLPEDIRVHGLVNDPHTGELFLVKGELFEEQVLYRSES